MNRRTAPPVAALAIALCACTPREIPTAEAERWRSTCLQAGGVLVKTLNRDGSLNTARCTRVSQQGAHPNH